MVIVDGLRVPVIWVNEARFGWSAGSIEDELGEGRAGWTGWTNVESESRGRFGDGLGARHGIVGWKCRCPI